MNNKAIDRIKYWGQLLLFPIYWLSFLMPRNKNIWLFGSTFGRRFADNPRYLYLYINQQEKERGIRAIWISRNKEIVETLQNKGYEAYYYHSFKGFWCCLRGKVYIFDNYSKDISFWLSGGAKKVNLWHGIPLKKIQADNIFDTVRHPKNMWEKFKTFPRRLSDEKPSHYVLTTSDYMVPIFSSAFRTKNVLTSGYPRNDGLISDVIENVLTDREEQDKNKIDVQINTGNKKMIYYMPTFRDSEKKFLEIMNLDAFREFLRQNNMIFCTKLHPKSKLKRQFNEIMGDNIFVIDADSDPYVFLEMADVLVTDYSSIYFDFLLADKPIVFFDYDLKEYLENSREMYFDYEEYTPGEKAEIQEKLEMALVRACSNDLEYRERYSQLRAEVADKVFNDKKHMASPRLTRDISKISGGSR